MIVRPAMAKDAEHVLRLLDACDMRASDVDYTRWDGFVLVAERQSEIVGFIHVLPARPYSVITHIAIAPGHRKGRATAKLMESAELILRHLNCGNWFTHVYEKDDNLRASAQHWGAHEAPSPGYLYKRVL